jgi:hypothetical protein
MTVSSNFRVIDAAEPYRWATFLLPVTLALGDSLFSISVLGARLFAFRLLSAGLFILSFVIVVVPRWTSIPVAAAYLQVGVFWVLYGLASLFWTPDVWLGAVEVTFVAFGFSLGILLLNFAIHKADRVALIRQGWVVAFIITGCVAVWEMATGQHLETSFTEVMAQHGLSTPFIQSTLGQPNNYGAFIVLCVPFITWSLFMATRLVATFFFAVLLAAATALVWLTGSRLSLLGLLLQAAVLPCCRNSGAKRVVLLGGLMVLLVMAMGAAVSVSSDTIQAMKLQALADEFSGGATSTQIRRNLAWNGLWFIVDSAGVGVGAGGFQPAIEADLGNYSTEHGEGELISDPHNFIIEIASQYGVFVFLAVCWYYREAWLVFWRGLRHAKRIGDRALLAQTASGVLGLSGFVVVSFANSTFIRTSHSWLFLASTVVMAANVHERMQAKKSRT